MNVEVSSSGAVLLGNRVSCDGFRYKYPLRVQTHLHMDHMGAFDTSKGLQHIVMSEPTRDLLISKSNAELPYRSNIEAAPTGKPIRRAGVQMLLLDSGHMLGSVQVCVTLDDGLRCGYSGDFNWPLEEVIQIDELVLDSTYGSPDSVRRFTQEEANSRLVEVVIEQMARGPVLIRAHPGTLQRALSCLSGVVKYPVVASGKICDELRVYRRYGYSLPEVYRSDTSEAKLVLQEGQHIRLGSFYERWPTNPGVLTTIILSAYMTRMDNPVIRHSDRSFGVALSDHADYAGTLEYVRATGAKRVLTDNTRGGHAVELALALKRELHVDARHSQFRPTMEWGK